MGKPNYQEVKKHLEELEEVCLTRDQFFAIVAGIVVSSYENGQIDQANSASPHLEF